jgi:drug/metabolite transporter (DMT)-like permease
VAARVAAGPVANAIQKGLTQRSSHPLAVVAGTHALLAAVCLPFVLWRSWPTATAFWVNMAVAALLAVLGNTLLVRALEQGDLSVLGPLNAYKPVVSVVVAALLLGETPTLAGGAGILLIVAGSYVVLAGERAATWDGCAFARFARRDGVRLRFAALAVSATEAVFLKRAMLAASPLAAFVAWCVLGLIVAAAALALARRVHVGREVAAARASAGTYVALAAATGVMQLTTVLAFGAMQVGYALALFQLSALVSVFLGHRYFRERDVRRRLAGAAVMVAGAALIVALGGRT